MIDNNRWVGTLPFAKTLESNQQQYDAEPNKWIDTIPKPKKNSKKSIKNFSFTLILFVIGLVLVSTIKNKTRNLQKEINNLQASINLLESDLDKTTLDFEVISSPENIKKLAQKYLEVDLIHYKKSQIKNLSETNEVINKSNITQLKKSEDESKLKVTKKLKEKVKIKIASNIKNKMIGQKKLYENPIDKTNLKKIKRWGTIQIVKVFLGIPVVPGR